MFSNGFQSTMQFPTTKAHARSKFSPFRNDEQGAADVLQPLIPPLTPGPSRDLSSHHLAAGINTFMGASGPASDQPSSHPATSPLLTLRRPSDDPDPSGDLSSAREKSENPENEIDPDDGCEDDENGGNGAGGAYGLSVVEDDTLGEGDGEKRGSLYRLHKLHLNSLLAAAQLQQQQNALFASPWAVAARMRAPSSHRGSATKLYVPTVPPSPGSSVHFFIGTNPTGSLASVMTGNGGLPGSLTPFAPYYFQPVLLKEKYAHYYRQQQFNNLLAASKGTGAGAEGSCASFLVSESGAVVLCRICQTPGTDATLISPCKCAGSVRYVHKNCLTKWLEINPNRNRKSQMCELCQYTYHRKKKFKFKDWKWPHCSSHDKLFHALFIIAVLVMMGCASAFIVCFRNDRGVHRNEELELSEGEIVTLSCGVLFFLSFFLGMYAEIKAHNPIYKICSQTISMNRSWIIDEYVDNGDDNDQGRRKTRPKARPRPKNFKKCSSSPLLASAYNVAGNGTGGTDENAFGSTTGCGGDIPSPPLLENPLGAAMGGGGGYMGMIDVLPTITEQQVVMVTPAQPVVSPADSDPFEPFSRLGQAKTAAATPTLATFLKKYNHIRACSYTQDDDRNGKDGMNLIGAAKSRPVPPTPSLLTRHASLPTGGGGWGHDARIL